MKNWEILLILIIFFCVSCDRDKYLIENIVESEERFCWNIDGEVYARLLKGSSFIGLSDQFRKACLAYETSY
ncbi:MAG TPA: hypothetical protein K8V05_07675 [Butyricimonas virosa]|uniref:Uncharacterized protein n=1 Tax=Butyricimonas virosa TaxID=544645 RepID=A0A921H3L6_9BACT|nr:hypothetical protein [Butyricimonas virosa]